MTAQVSRADLLRALHMGRSGALALEHTDLVWWGYVPATEERRHVDTVVLPVPAVAATHRSESVPTAGAPVARSALRMPEVWVAQRTDLASALDPPVGDPAPSGAERPPLRVEDLLPELPPAVRYQDLVPLPRLVGPLQRQLLQPRSSGLNVPALLRAASRRRWPQVLPRRARHVWPDTLVVLLDFAVELFPYRYDMYRLAELLQARVPKAHLQVMVGWHGPFGDWEPLDDDADPQPSGGPLRPRPGHAYLVVSDLGLLRAAGDAAAQWRAWLGQARAPRCRTVALAPVASDDIAPSLAECARILRWSPDSRWQPERGHKAAEQVRSRDHGSQSLSELLHCLAATLRMDPPLLRTLRQRGSAPQDASLEGRLWCHPDVHAGSHATLRHSGVPPSLALRRPLSSALSAALHACTAEHHRHWPLALRTAELVQQVAVLPQAPPELVHEARCALQRLTERLQQASGDTVVFVDTAEYILRRTPPEARPALGAALDALANAAGQPTGPRQPWCLLQRGAELWIAPAGDVRPAGPGVVLCGDIGQAAAGELVRIAQPQRLPGYQPLPAEGMLRLAALSAGSVVTLGGVETALTRRRRTRGVWGWSQADGGVVETLDLPVSMEKVGFPADAWRRMIVHGSGKPEGDRGFYTDRDDYGVFLELRSAALVANGYPLNQPLRFRYLEPATFLQGSPEGTGYDDEHPQHPVTLTRGLWLAETPCTQALWQAVMGKNPSRFKQGEDAPRRPVERVSWDDVTAFLQTLQLLLPQGCEAVLPTESQWEYACRAGTQTEYWWGDEPDETQANFAITVQQEGDDQEGTTPVDHYPPNPWGLYDMHGNVWEWCADGMRDYATEPARDPEVLGVGDLRVVRGGSWFYRSGSARAASRGGWPRGHTGLSLGFRFALRSPSGPEALPGGLGARRGGVAGGGTDGADAPVGFPPVQAVQTRDFPLDDLPFGGDASEGPA